MGRSKNELKGNFEVVHQTVSTALRGLYVWAELDREDAIEVRFKHRGGGDWLAIVKRYGDDGGPQVLFAQAYDFVGALIASARALEIGQWKVDKPYEPDKK